MTGGSLGLTGVPGPGQDDRPVRRRRGLQQARQLLLHRHRGDRGVALLILYYLERAYISFQWRAIKDDNTLAGAVGINVIGYKMVNFVIAAFMAGLSGAVFASFQHNLSPDSTSRFGVTMSIYLLVYMVVGGKDYFIGPLVGTAVLTLLAEETRSMQQYQPMIIGAIAILVMIFMPMGLVGMPAVRGWRLKMRRLAEAARRIGRAFARLPATTARGGDQRRKGDRHGDTGSQRPLPALRRTGRGEPRGLTVEEGEILGLIGPNGAGKSTMLNLIDGTLKVSGRRHHLPGSQHHPVSAPSPGEPRYRPGVPEERPVQEHDRPGERPGRDPTCRPNMDRGECSGTVSSTCASSPTSSTAAWSCSSSWAWQDRTHELSSNLPHGSQRELCVAVASGLRPRPAPAGRTAHRHERRGDGLHDPHHQERQQRAGHHGHGRGAQRAGGPGSLRAKCGAELWPEAHGGHAPRSAWPTRQ